MKGAVRLAPAGASLREKLAHRTVLLLGKPLGDLELLRRE